VGRGALSRLSLDLLRADCGEPRLSAPERQRFGSNHHPRAVSADAPAKIRLHEPLTNCGCWSRHDLGEQNIVRGEEVETIHPLELPECDLLKIDTEGCELEILLAYPHLPSVIVLEYHRESDRHAIETLLIARGYWLRELQGHCLHRGVMKFWKIQPPPKGT